MEHPLVPDGISSSLALAPPGRASCPEARSSPVFDVQFYGRANAEEDDDDAASQCSIAIGHMQPAVVFRALLHFDHIHGRDAVHGRIRC